MTDVHDIVRRLDEYAEKIGLEPSTVCRRATNNPRLRERMIAKVEKLEQDVRALEAYMREHPAPEAREPS